MYKAMGETLLASLILATSKKRGDFSLEERDCAFYCVAPPPYISGVGYRALSEELNLTFIPPLERAEKMDFAGRIQEGFRLSLIRGMDVFVGASSVLASIGRRFAGEDEKAKMPMSSLLHPLAMGRAIKAIIRSKLARRSILPKDIWRLKGIASGGTDAKIYGKLIEYYWGVQPLEGYGSTEFSTGGVAVQLWDFGSMVFIPHSNFIEFIPEKESIKSQKDPNYRPRILLLNEVEPDQIYELVITNFYGGVFVRYKMDDLIRIVSLRNEKLGVDTPQLVFHSRASELIDLAGFARLTEKAIWQAIENSGVKYTDWTARKEIEDKQPVLHLYLELRSEKRREEEIVGAIHESLKKIDPDYDDIEKMLQLKPVRLTVLSPSTFQRYILKQQKEGADLGQLKPRHMNPSDETIDDLLRLSKQE